MAYIRCFDCDWNQDDFWTEDYNPIISIFHWKDNFLEYLKKSIDKRKILVGKRFMLDYNVPGEPNGYGDFNIEFKDFIMVEFHNIINRIKNMKWWTEKDWKNDPDPYCPICKSRHLVID